MSGAPVVRGDDGAVAGVVSGRYNSADGWLAGTVWVARTEDLVVLLAGIAEAAILEPSYDAAVDLVLMVTRERVQLIGPRIDVAAPHGGVRPGLAEAVNESRRARARAGQALDVSAEAKTGAGELSLARTGRLLGESFLPAPVAERLAQVLAASERAHQPVRLGLAVDAGLASLPWECLPGPSGRGPLVLNPLVRLYRKASAGAPRAVPGPLRIVAAIAPPMTAAVGWWTTSGTCAA